MLLVAVFTIVLLAGASVRGKFQYSYVDQAITTILSPLEAGLSYAGYGFRRATTIVREIFSVYQENQQLKAEIEVDRQNILDTTEIVAENDRLHALLDYKKRSTQFDLVTAAVVGRDLHPFARGDCQSVGCSRGRLHCRDGDAALKNRD